MSRVDGAAVEERLHDVPRRHPARAIAIGVIGFLLLGLLAWRMVPHPVGPARTSAKYLGKAVTTARAAQSDVATAGLVSDAASRNHTFGPYTALVVSDAEAAVSGLQGTFDSIQPPDAASDEVRTELDGLLSDATDHLSEVRIAARRGTIDELARIARPLSADARRLERFVERNS